MIATIIAARTAVLAAASAAAPSARRALAKTAAIATQPFGLATPSTVPPASEESRSRFDSSHFSATSSKVMGHEDAWITLSRYAHLYDRQRTDEAVREAMASAR
jgi:hypothetical protein